MILEPKFSLNSFLQLDYLPSLASFLYNPLIFDLLLNLISPCSSRFSIDESSQIEIWKVCYDHDIFLDLSRQMLRGAEISARTKSTIDFDKYNFPFKYEKNVRNQLNSTESVKVDLDKVLGRNTWYEQYEKLAIQVPFNIIYCK